MVVKKVSGTLLVFLLIMILSVPCLAKERIGVLGFSGQVGEEYRQAAINKLTQILFTFGKYDLVERAEIERIIEEQHFQLSNVVDPTSVVQVGNLLGIKIAYIGNIDQLTATRDKRNLYYQATARVTVKVIDVETGKILNIISGEGFCSDKSRQDSLHTALERCFTERMIASIRVKIAPYSKIIKVDGDYIYFINGKDLGVTKGTRYQILRPISTGFDDTDLNTDDSSKGFEEEAVNNDDTFKRQIGLVEVKDVIDNKSKAKIIWLSGSVHKSDLLQEVVNPAFAVFTLDVHTIPVRSWDDTVLLYNNDRVSVYEGAIGVEKPFSGSALLNWGFSVANPRVSIMNFDFQKTWEMSIIPGSLYFVPSGSVGMGFGFQDYMPYRSGMATGLYLKGGLGLKYYVNHENGAQIELAVIGQYGPFLTEWADYSREYGDTDVTWLMNDKWVEISGYGLQLTFDIPLK